jgi:hypothetical protein
MLPQQSTFWLFVVSVLALLGSGDAFKGCQRPSIDGGHHHLYWVHIPKTGTSFSLPLMHQCCPDEYELAASTYEEDSYKIQHQRVAIPGLPSTCTTFTSYGHDPLCGSIDALEDVVTVLRSPVHRIVSSFEDSMHHEGMDDGTWERLNSQPIANESALLERVLARHPRADVHRVTSALRYFSHPNMRGCQAKMLLGEQCSAPLVVSAKELATALATLRRLQFVGIFEDWNGTVDCFFRNRRRLYNDNNKLHPVNMDYMLTRPGHYSASEEGLAEIVLEELGYVDNWDTQLYEEGRRIYKQMCLEHEEDEEIIGENNKESEGDKHHHESHSHLHSQQRHRQRHRRRRRRGLHSDADIQ